MSATFVIVDDDPAFRSVAAALLTARGFNVVGEAEAGDAGIALIGKWLPTAVLLDLQLPDRDGLSVAGWIHDRHPETRVLLTSAGDFRPHAEQLLAAGVDAFAPKERLGEVDLVSALSL
jgi:DNA-binding NarL/FixJ family response regulator